MYYYLKYFYTIKVLSEISIEIYVLVLKHAFLILKVLILRMVFIYEQKMFFYNVLDASQLMNVP